MKKILLAIALCVVAIAAGAVVASAAIPDSKGTIDACYLNIANARYVRVIDTESGQTCTTNETALDWLSRGGAVFEDHAFGPQNITGGAIVARLTLPAGRYSVAAKTSAEDTSGLVNFIQCGLIGMTTNEASRSTVAANGFEALAVLGVVQLATETDVELFCNANTAAEVEMTVLTASSVSSIENQ